MRNVSRRELLQAAAAGTATAFLPSADASDDTRGEIPAPFDQMPTIDDPTEQEREDAVLCLPPRAVPDEGPIPDYVHSYTVEKEIVIPEWALEAARWQAGYLAPEDRERHRVEGMLIDYAYIEEQYVTPDGRDAVEAILNEVRATTEEDA